LLKDLVLQEPADELLFDWMKDSELTKPLLEPAPGSSVEVGTHLRLLVLTVE